MWKSFVVLFLATVNFSAFLECYKITSDRISKIDEVYREDSTRRDDADDGVFSSEKTNARPHGGQRIIGKWRNNGEALEPKWRDGDSVPLAPFSMATFESGWRKKSTPAILPAKSENFREGRRTKYHVTLDNHPDEYELIENEHDSPRPRKRRPPENYEFVESKESQASSRRDYEESQLENNGKTTEFHGKDAENGAGLEKTVNKSRNNGTGNQESRTSVRNEARTTETEELKSLLKMQRDNLSLSEILQQKNLTLADLLRGKANAIDALKSNSKLSRPNEQSEIAFLGATPGNAEEKRFGGDSNRPRWMPRRKLIVRKMYRNPVAADKPRTEVNVYDAKLGTAATSRETVARVKSELNSRESHETRNDNSAFIKTKFPESEETISPETNEETRPTSKKQSTSEIFREEIPRPLENGESLFVETTTVDETITDYILDDERIPTSTEKIEAENSEEDEIMEFSDHPAHSPKLISVPVYETAMKVDIINHGFSAITSSHPTSQGKTKSTTPQIYSSTVIPSIIIGSTTEKFYEIKQESTIQEIDSTTLRTTDDRYPEMKNGFERTETTFLQSNATTLPENWYDRKTLNEHPGSTTIVSLVIEDKNSPAGNEFVEQNRKRNGKTGKIFADTNDTAIKSDETLNEKETFTAKRQYNYHTILPKVDADSRAEIEELFSSESSAERLERLLASRNMTIEELIALRQRGSSHVHLAEVFRVQSETPTLQKSKDVTETTTRDHSNRKVNIPSSNEHKETKVDSKNDTRPFVSHLFESFSQQTHSKNNYRTLNNMNQDSDSVRNPNAQSGEIRSNTGLESYAKINEEARNNESVRKMNQFPPGDNIQRDSQGSSYYTSIEEVEIPNADKTIRKFFSLPGTANTARPNLRNGIEIGRVEEIANNELKFNATVYDINDGQQYHDKRSLSKVKPSIIASGGILGVTVVVFLSIFIACRIRQKKKFNYGNTFSKAVFQNPVMTTRKLSNTSSVNTIMVDVVATSTAKRSMNKNDSYDDDEYDSKSDIDSDSLDANDSWDTIPDFMK